MSVANSFKDGMVGGKGGTIGIVYSLSTLIFSFSMVKLVVIGSYIKSIDFYILS